MAKTAKPKNRPVSVRSRAARRATSPSLNLDKSLKNIRAPSEDAERKTENQRYAAIGSYGGISKKKKQKKLSRAQKLRLKKGIERADNVAGHLEKKVQEAEGRHKSVKSRRADWEDLNAKINPQDVKVHDVAVASRNPFVGLKMDEGRDRIPVPEPGEEVVLPMMIGKPPPRLIKNEIT